MSSDTVEYALWGARSFQDENHCLGTSYTSRWCLPTFRFSGDSCLRICSGVRVCLCVYTQPHTAACAYWGSLGTAQLFLCWWSVHTPNAEYKFHRYSWVRRETQGLTNWRPSGDFWSCYKSLWFPSRPQRAAHSQISLLTNHPLGERSCALGPDPPRGLHSKRGAGSMELHGSDDFRGPGLSLGHTLPEIRRIQFSPSPPPSLSNREQPWQCVPRFLWNLPE